MKEKEVIEKTIDFVKKSLDTAEGWHDWRHIYRVWKTAKHIAKQEPVNMFIVELGALLHDIADSKFHGGDEEIGPRIATDFLQELHIEESTVNHVANIIRHISFKGWQHAQLFTSPELAVVQDADRLDALWAIGIARAFNYGGYKWRELYNPDIRPNLTMTKEEYKNSTAPTINHFYEKLLLLKNKMNTKTGKAMAEHRHWIMEDFLNEFYQEWDGEK